MARFVLFCFVLFCFVLKTESQNLVPNPSFETYNSCTNILITSADGWCTVANQVANCAHLHPCHSDTYTQAPLQYLDNCFKSYQMPHSGIAYAEFGMSISASQQEGARPMIKLIDTLETGKIYCVTYYVSMWNNARYSFDKLGALLTPTPFPCSISGGTVFPTIAGQYTPQVVSTPSVALEDTLGWMEISGTFTSVGDEAYLTLGDFFLHSQHLIKNSYPTNCNGLAEYYIDDVSVEEVEIAKAKNDTLINQGDSAIVGLNNSEAALFSWQPAAGLSCTNCPNPNASPTITTTYTVTKTQCKAVTSDVITITVSPVGLSEKEQLEKNLFIYPNPSKDKINIKINVVETEHFYIKLTDVLGKEIMYDKLKAELDISYLEDGIYFLSFYKNNKLFITKKVIKQ